MYKTLESRATYPKKPFKPFAAKVWKTLFSLTKDTGDVAFWRIDAGGIILSIRDSGFDESSPEWEDGDYVSVLVDGICEQLDAIPYEDEEQIEARTEAFRAWAEKGIKESFQSAAVQKLYQRFNPDGNNFAVVSGEYDDGLGDTELSLLWTHKKHFNVSRIKARQKAARKKREAEEEAGTRKKMVLRPVKNASVAKAMAMEDESSQ